MKLIKLVYSYDLDRDKVAARHYYDDDTHNVQYHSRSEWQDLLYDIRENQPQVQIRTVVQQFYEVQE